jgi:hypothetical protein
MGAPPSAEAQTRGGMIVVMLDNDISGHVGILRETAKSTGWDEYGLINFVTLEDEGLATDAKDRQIWNYCQENGIVLLTGNRNQNDPDSLGIVIEEQNTDESLPVITVADPQRLADAGYRTQCLESMLEIVLDINNYLGTARIFIPF